MATLTICIGNSDDKLSQREWSWYWANTSSVVNRYAGHVHGEFLSQPSAAFQNACWVVEGELTEEFLAELADMARHFRQDSIAVSVGSTVLVSPPGTGPVPLEGGG